MDIDNRVIRSIIDKSEAGLRLDLWLSCRFSYHSRNQWQSLIKGGAILRNRRRARASAKLKADDVIEFILPNNDEPEVDLNYEVIHEDPALMIINKPANLPCHPSGRFYRHTLWYSLCRKYGKVHIVNRLDRETSGLIIIAMHSQSARVLMKSMVQSEIQKRYAVAVFGRFPELLHAKGYLIPEPTSKIRKKRTFVYSVPGNVPADQAEKSKTAFRLLCTDNSWSLVEATLFTGRFHQIRATVYSLGFPVIGDKLYGKDEMAYLRFTNHCMEEHDYADLILKRQALHARFLLFTHPETGKKMQFEIQLPDDMLYLEKEIQTKSL